MYDKSNFIVAKTVYCAACGRKCVQDKNGSPRCICFDHQDAGIISCKDDCLFAFNVARCQDCKVTV